MHLKFLGDFHYQANFAVLRRQGMPRRRGARWIAMNCAMPTRDATGAAAGYAWVTLRGNWRRPAVPSTQWRFGVVYL